MLGFPRAAQAAESSAVWLEIRSRGRPKRSGKLQKTALFDSSNRFASARQGCQRFARSAKGDEDGGNTMLRIRTGARDGLRWGLFGFVAAFLTLTNDATKSAPYADIGVDANSGASL